MVRFKSSGFDDLQRQLENMARRAESLHGEHEVPFSELFTESFMQKCSSFSSLDDLLRAGNFIVESNEDFDSIPEDALDAHISSVTCFRTWEEMLEAASSEYVSRALGF